MANLGTVARYVRSKNAGPFWVTIDIFFQNESDYVRYSNSKALAPESLGQRLAVDPARIGRYEVPELYVLKFSYPRTVAQGGRDDRDVHSGQAFASLLSLEM